MATISRTVMRLAVDAALLGQVAICWLATPSGFAPPGVVQDPLEQRRLAATIGTDHRQQRTGRHLAMQMMHHRVTGIAQSEIIKKWIMVYLMAQSNALPDECDERAAISRRVSVPVRVGRIGSS